MNHNREDPAELQRHLEYLRDGHEQLMANGQFEEAAAIALVIRLLEIELGAAPSGVITTH